MFFHDYIDASTLLTAHVSEQCVDEKNDPPHLHSFLNGVPKIVGKGIQEALIVVPIGRHLHADGTSYEYAAGDHEEPPGLRGQVPQESEVHQAENDGRDPSGNRPGEVDHAIESFVKAGYLVQRKSREGH